ncbi:DUF3080 family protein [Marinomonas sp.]
MRAKPFRHLIILSFIILFAAVGCDSRFQTKDLFEDYIADLNRSQLVQIDSPDTVFPLAYPPLRDRLQALSEFDIGLLDFLSLQQCDVGAVAGQRNSILGKVMPTSQRFLYELDIIRAIESCQIQDEGLLNALENVAWHKRHELPIAFGNAVFNDTGRESFFSLSNGYLPLDYSTAHNQALLSALNGLLGIAENLKSLPVVDGAEFEQDLKALTDSEYIGRLIFSLVQITEYLNAVTEGVNNIEKGQCGSPIHYLATQFEDNYVQRLQPYMARINRSAYQILPQLMKLIELTEPLTDALNVYVEQISLSADIGVWAKYQQASAQHARSWSQLLASCGTAIGGAKKG